MKISSIIVDDEPLARKGLKEYLAEIAFMELVKEFDDSVVAIDFLQHNHVDAVFLDINMPKVSGLELVRSLSAPPLIIFTTAYREFAADSYELGGFDYLVKPITFERFLKSCTRISSNLKKAGSPGPVIDLAEDHFFIKENGILLKIVFDNILFIEGFKDYVKIHLQHKMHLALISLQSVIQNLPGNSFIRVHKSYIINKTKVDFIEGNTLSISGRKIPVGKTYRDTVIKEIIGENLWRRGREG